MQEVFANFSELDYWYTTCSGRKHWIMTVKPEDFPTPGKYIRALLEERGWDQRTLARVLGLEYPSLNRIVTDKKHIDGFAALMLGDAFNVPPENFLGVRTRYELAVARASTTPDAMRSVRAAVYGSLPVSEMVRRGWLDVVFEDPERVEAELARFFGVLSIEEIPIVPHAARKMDQFGDTTPSQLAWLYQVRRIASTLQVPRYSPAAVREAIDKLEGLLFSVEGVGKVPDILAAAGIRFVVVESLSTAKIDGVCTWLNDMAPVIGMSLRHDRIDNFWFVLRHECEHLLHGHGRKHPRVDVDLEGVKQIVPDEERIANNAASDFCVPKESMDAFYMKKQPFFMKQDIIGFAASQRRHPGLVVGQLQHRAGRFDRFREYLHKVRHLVIRGVAADGWGHAYPVAEQGRVQ